MEIKKSEIRIVDPAQAQKLLDQYPYDRQRKLDAKRVAYYAKMIEQGEFAPGHPIAVAYAPNGDGKAHGHLVNGRHRLSAVIQANCAAIFTLQEFACKTLDEVADLYGTIDTGKPRGIRDHIQAKGLDQEFGFNAPADADKLSGAVAFIHAGFKDPVKHDLTPDERIALMRHYSLAALAYFMATSPTTQGLFSLLRRAPTMAVGLVTLSESVNFCGEKLVNDFWAGIARDDGLKVGDPRKVVINHLLTTPLRGRRTTGMTQSAAKSARTIAQCFNAWVAGRSIKHTHVKDESLPIVIVGSQYR